MKHALPCFDTSVLARSCRGPCVIFQFSLSAKDGHRERRRRKNEPRGENGGRGVQCSPRDGPDGPGRADQVPPADPGGGGSVKWLNLCMHSVVIPRCSVLVLRTPGVWAVGYLPEESGRRDRYDCCSSRLRCCCCCCSLCVALTFGLCFCFCRPSCAWFTLRDASCRGWCWSPPAFGQVSRGAKPKYSGMVDCARQLHATGGLRSVFKGWEVTLMRDVPG